MKDHMFKVRTERYVFMIDHRSYTQNCLQLSLCNITIETKLQIFQYKIIHNILPTKFSLFRMNLCDSETCHLCKT